MSLAPNGLMAHDLYRILMLAEEGANEYDDQLVNFGDITKFIEEIVSQESSDNFSVFGLLTTKKPRLSRDDKQFTVPVYCDTRPIEALQTSQVSLHPSVHD